MSDLELVMQSFELAGERVGDIAPAAYEAYFERCPESRALMRFVDDHMRGRMMQQVLLVLMGDSADAGPDYLSFETRTHVSYGVEPHMYANLLTAVRDCVQRALGSQWNDAYAAAWDTRLSHLLTEIVAASPGAA